MKTLITIILICHIYLLKRAVPWLMDRARGIKIWHPCNIYPSAKIGRNVSIGMFSEIGANVEIGEGTRIGMGVFIPEGVTIGKNCFIGPKVCFTNDMYPPSAKSQWMETTVKDRANIGAGAVIRPGVTIGKCAVVGAGSVVTRDILSGDTVAGVPAKVLRKGKTDEINA